MKITKDIIEALEKAKNKIKNIETKFVPLEFRKDSEWLKAVFDIIDRTALALRDELEQIE